MTGDVRPQPDSRKSKAAKRRKTRREIAREYWEREGWHEPRDEAQEKLYALFFLGEAIGEGDLGSLDGPWFPRYWTRPERWVEELVRA